LNYNERRNTVISPQNGNNGPDISNAYRVPTVVIASPPT